MQFANKSTSQTALKNPKSTIFLC